MKKFLILFIFMFSLGSAKENELSIDIKKETNGDSYLSIPHLKIIDKKGLFLHEMILDLLFHSERGALGIPNHHAIVFDNAFGIEYNDVFVTFSLDLKYYLAENDSNIEEGFDFGNTLRFGIKF